MFEDGVGGDALDAVVTDLASDISQGSGPRVRWFEALAFTGARSSTNVAFAWSRRVLMRALAH